MSMSDWLREVEHAGYSYSVQYSGPDSERTPLLAREASIACVKVFWVIFLTILFCTGVGIGCYLIIQQENEYSVTKPYIFISRSGWRSLPASSPIPSFPGSVNHVAIIQTNSDSCDSSAECAKLIRNLQRSHMYQRNLSDIAYNFLVAGDGATYEGRGWKIQPGIKEEGSNEEKTLVAAFVGNFDYALPPQPQIEEFQLLLNEAVSRGALDPCFTISLLKDHPQEGAGQLVHVYNRLVMENNKRKAKIPCS